MQPEHLRDNEYNVALQDRYDELIQASRDVWAESAAGGFARKKADPSNKSVYKSPETSKAHMKEISRKDSSISATD